MVFITPATRPILSCRTFTSGARQLVVQEAFEMTVWVDFSTPWLTPYTTVASTSSPPGAEITTFFAPAAMCADALALLVNRPVHSSTKSTPSSPQGSLDGSAARP